MKSVFSLRQVIYISPTLHATDQCSRCYRPSKGGARYEWNQDEKFHQELDAKAYSIAAAKRSLSELELELSKVETSLVNLVSEIQYREAKIKTSQSQQHQIT
jgi:hypothetical protein